MYANDRTTIVYRDHDVLPHLERLRGRGLQQGAGDG